MITIRATSLAKSLKNLERLRKRVSDTADGRFRQKVLYLFEYALKVSPQFSGDFASNWHMVVDSGASPAYKVWPAKGVMQTFQERKRIASYGGVVEAPRKAGDPEAVNFALTRARFKLKGVTRNSKISFVNTTSLTTDGSQMIGPDGKVNLRPENLMVLQGRRIESHLRTVAKGL